uniref:Ephrin RBD domain-containing protein n=1 Tax=Romanomermis culicivorax TaxID=13658 RepID=A0A915HWA8_ROMCU
MFLDISQQDLSIDNPICRIWNKKVSLTLKNSYSGEVKPQFSKENKEIIYVQILDKIEFVCPTYRNEVGSNLENVEQLIIYRVDEIGYKSCTVNQPSKSLIGICSNPARNSRIPVVFRDFTPLPNLMEYRPGKSYYFISTSNGTRNGLYNLDGGLCSKKNMRLKVHVRKMNSFSNYYAYRSKPYRKENDAATTERPEIDANDDVRWVGVDGRRAPGPWWSVDGAYAYVKLPSENL